MLITAPLIHNGLEFLPAGSVIEIGDDGIIVAIHSDINSSDVQFFEGILCPGFVNVHCHLELSHLKNKLPEHSGLIPFLQKIPSFRNEFDDEQKKIARHAAHEELLDNGIVAVGDIANVTDTLDLRALDQLHFHSFTEAIGFTEINAGQRFDAAKQTFQSFAEEEVKTKLLRQSIIPHAPYSVSKKFFQLIDEHKTSSLISIHNQESKAEDEYYRGKTGGVKDLLHGFSIDDNFFIPSEKSSIQTYGDWLSPDHSCIFVHNTYTSSEDVRYAMNRFINAFWCLCPNANLYLENQLPDVNMLSSLSEDICVGTDSLASNHELNILSELKTLKKNFQKLDWGKLLKWGTYNGAKALRMEDKTGSIETGKIPGIVNVRNIDSEKPTIRRII